MAAWRQFSGHPPVPAGQWAPDIRLQSVTIETRERENGGTDLRTRLRFLDDNRAFDGRPIEAVIENGQVTDISVSD